jgi:hypothetical protein
MGKGSKLYRSVERESIKLIARTKHCYVSTLEVWAPPPPRRHWVEPKFLRTGCLYEIIIYRTSRTLRSSILISSTIPLAIFSKTCASQHIGVPEYFDSIH